MDLQEVLNKNTFPEEPLDSKDRHIIQVLYSKGPEGAGFNGLVELSRPFASRSTVALRVERLVRLGYLERVSNGRPGRLKPIRLSVKCLGVMSILQEAKAKTAYLVRSLREIDSKIKSKKHANIQWNAKELRNWYDQFKSTYNGLFGLTGSMAVFYGTSAAGDLFLPLILEDYKLLSGEFMGVLRNNPALLSFVRENIQQRLETEGTSLENISKEVKGRIEEWEKASATQGVPIA